MTLHEISSTDYLRLFPKSQVVYNTPAFTELNASKVKRVIRLMFESDHGKPVLGLTVGETADGMFKAPFSAPFACFDFNKEQNADVVQQAADELASAFPGLQITLPPAPYCPSMNAKTQLALLSSGARALYSDWNYHIDLTSFAPGEYADSLNTAERWKLRRVKQKNLTVEPCEPLRAYEIIKINKAAHGYPLRMTAEQVVATISNGGPVAADSFVLTDGTTDLAAAIIYHASPGIAQVIYWGHIPTSPHKYVMNLLAETTAEHYKSLKFKTLDIGPSSEDGIPNLSLCEFKESIGCRCTVKPTLILPIFNA